MKCVARIMQNLETLCSMISLPVMKTSVSQDQDGMIS